MYINRVLFILFFLVLCSPIFSQFYIKGQVKDEKGNTLQNVTIVVHSTDQLFRSGGEGRFGINASKINDSLTFSFEGFATFTKQINANEYNNITLVAEKKQIAKATGGLSSLVSNFNHSSQDQYYSGNETYSSLFENNFINTGKNPSTEIALNYNRASYSNIRRFLNLGYSMPSDAIRIEEMLNYFNLEIKEPEQGKDFKINSRVSSCPWNKENTLLFLNICTKKIDLNSLPPSNLVFLIDVSSSMDMPNRLPLLKSAFKVLVNNLREKDTVSLVVYGGITGTLINGLSGKEKVKIINIIDSLQPGGATPGESGIKLAYRIARNHFIKGGNNRVILATDGDFNIGVRSEDELEKLIAQQNIFGISLTCLGVGMGNYKDSKIQALAQKGSGNFAYLDNYAEAEKVLFNEFFQTLYTVAGNVIMSVQFNPEFVKQYRLIGYDNKTTAIRNKSSSLEGGEIGSGNSLVVAFEIVPQRTSSLVSGPVGDINLSYTAQNRESRTLKYLVPFQLSDFETIENDFKLATAIIMFGMKLKKSDFAKNIKWNSILDLAKNSISPLSFTEQEFVRLIEAARDIYKKENRWRLFKKRS